MAELCRKCFIEIWRPDPYDIRNIVMSEDNDMCECCMNWGPYVHHIGAALQLPKDIDLGFLFDELITEDKDEQT